MEAIDRKFRFTAVHTTKNTTFTEKEAVLFLAKDPALPDTLRYYYDKCKRLGAEPLQMRGIELLIQRVDQYQLDNKNKIKVADVDPGEEEAQVCKPNES